MVLVDMEYDEHTYRYTVHIAQFDPEQLEVTVRDNRLRVSGKGQLATGVQNPVSKISNQAAAISVDWSTKVSRLADASVPYTISRDKTSSYIHGWILSTIIVAFARKH
ncbi:hypothetical protein AB1Y20_007449 [Prymnesium parvum]|uniref:SHSP domain-containing protein n=1 Tax=Prymnesium parvum TaxID=97485 RepID=A0AB34IV21_PRYPA